MRIRLNLRKPKSSAPTPINIIIRYGGLRTVYPSGELIHPKYWDLNKQRVKNLTSFPQNGEFNHRLELLKTTIQETILRYQNGHQKAFPSVDELKSLLDIELKKKAPKLEENDLLAYCRKFVDESENRLNPSGQPISKNTRKHYKGLLNILLKYASFKKKKNLLFSSIDHKFYIDFVKYMKDECLLIPNSQGSHIKTLKVVLNDAEKNELSVPQAYKKFKVAKEPSSSIYLSETDLKELFHLDVSENRRLERTRDLFLVGCWTGLRFSDFSQLKPENFLANSISIKTRKDQKQILIPLHPIISAIRTKYDTYNKLPAAMSNQKMNDYLKEICKLAPSLCHDVEIEKYEDGVKVFVKVPKYTLVSSHTARRSFATNLFLSGFPTRSIMKITGHQKESVFYNYIKLTPNEDAERLRIHWQKEDTLLKVVS